MSKSPRAATPGRRKNLETDERTFSTNDIVRCFPVSHRQLQWWDEQRVVMPEHVSHKKIYTRTETIQIGAILRLRDCGLSLQKIRRLLSQLSARLASGLDFPVYGLANGKNLYWYDDADEIIRKVCELKTPARLIDLRSIINTVDNYNYRSVVRRIYDV